MRLFCIHIGAELLNALFRQTFSVGTPFPAPAMQMRTRQEHSRETQPSTSAEPSSFPGDGKHIYRCYRLLCILLFRSCIRAKRRPTVNHSINL